VRIGAGVYVPRAQTEKLARRAAAALDATGSRAVDLCTGCGAVAVHLAAAVPRATVVGVDIDILATACARANGVAAVVGDVDGPLRRRAFDVVTAVPPYVPTAALALLPADVRRHEPRLALDGGPDGLDIARRVVQAAARLLRPGGWLFVEVGGDEDEQLAPTLRTEGFDGPASWYDGEGDLRGVAAQLR
jgi:release factor glutamine methyltransferase